MRTTIAAVTAGLGLVTVVTAAMLLLGVEHVEAQPKTAAPAGEEYSTSLNCQEQYQQASARINAQHSQDLSACHGKSDCIRTANAKKRAALEVENGKLSRCNAAQAAARSTPSLQPRPTPTVAPAFQPGRPGTFKPQTVVLNGDTWAVYTDLQGQPWRFKAEFPDDPSDKQNSPIWVLDRSTVNPNGTYAGRNVPTATYRKRGMLGEPTGSYWVYPAQTVDNFPYR